MVSVRVSQATTLFLGLASVTVGVLSIILHKPMPGYQVMLLVLPLSMVCVVLLRMRRNIAVDGRRNLAQGKVKRLLAASVSPRDYPPCVRLCVAHANAVSVAGLSSRNVLLRIAQLIMMITHELEELKPREKAFCVNVVETHLRILRSIHSIIETLSSNGSLLAECYRQLRQGSDVMRVIDEAGVMMESTIIRPMDNFIQSIPPGVDRYVETDEYKDKITKLITEEVHGELAALMGMILSIQQTAREIHEEMQVDWHDDTQECWGDFLCRPVRIRDFPRKAGMKIDSVEKTVANWTETMQKIREQAKNNQNNGS